VRYSGQKGSFLPSSNETTPLYVRTDGCSLLGHLDDPALYTLSWPGLRLFTAGYLAMVMGRTKIMERITGTGVTTMINLVRWWSWLIW
jgi:hypothetical protein